MKKQIILIILLLVMFQIYNMKKQNQVCFKNICFDVELAKSIEERNNGLSFRESLDPEKGMLFVSLARLKDEFYGNSPNMPKLRERIVKECLHVLGHYVGSEHCYNKECIMSYSPSVNDIDIKSKDFCETCKNKLRASGVYL